MKQCTVIGCNNEILAKGLCRKHYLANRRKNNPKKCKVENCTNAVTAKELCSKHYRQYTTQGKILSRTKFDRNKIIIEGIAAYIDIYDFEGNISCKAIIDIDDIDKIKDTKWKSMNGYIYNVKTSHSLGEAVLGKPKKGYKIIHKNKDLLDCRKENLVLSKTNRRNNNFKHNTSGRKGVYKLNKKGVFTGDYLVYITFNQKTRYLGKRSNFDEAVKLRESEEEKLGWLET